MSSIPLKHRAGTGARAWPSASAVLAAALVSACGGGGSSSGTAAAESALSDTARLGRLIFEDTSLSGSGRLACASCHSPEHAHAPANALAAQMGGVLAGQQGHRSAPSIRYLSFNGAFHFAADGTPTGGFFWDGRSNSLQEQASRPLFTAHEMANANAAELVDKLKRATYAATFQQVFGSDIFTRPDAALARLTLSLQQYQREDGDFHPFSSKYDAFLRGRQALSEQELRGLALFNRSDKGNCAACHPSAKAADGSHPLFTDFSYDSLGVPRNPELVQNDDPDFFDLGLCARDGGDLLARTDLCGAFKVPSLRNVARKQAYFHNGRFKSLKEALNFYGQRDTQPQKWYPLKADGTPDKFNDLPARYRGNVNTTEVPYNRRPGDAPALSDAEIDDVIAFLNTLSDGFAP